MLADRLIQDQVKCAQQQEEICVLRQKVATSSRQNSADSSLQVTCQRHSFGPRPLTTYVHAVVYRPFMRDSLRQPVLGLSEALLLICVSLTIIGQPRNSVLIHRV